MQAATNPTVSSDMSGKKRCPVSSNAVYIAIMGTTISKYARVRRNINLIFNIGISIITSGDKYEHAYDWAGYLFF